MQAFFRAARVPKFRFVAAMLLVLEVPVFTFPNLSLLLKSKMATIAFTRPKYACNAGYFRRQIKKTLYFSETNDNMLHYAQHDNTFSGAAFN